MAVVLTILVFLVQILYSVQNASLIVSADGLLNGLFHATGRSRPW